LRVHAILVARFRWSCSRHSIANALQDAIWHRPVSTMIRLWS
jgi:hypothetical protein